MGINAHVRLVHGRRNVKIELKFWFRIRIEDNHVDLDREDDDEEADGEEGEAGDDQGHLPRQ